MDYDINEWMNNYDFYYLWWFMMIYDENDID